MTIKRTNVCGHPLRLVVFEQHRTRFFAPVLYDVCHLENMQPQAQQQLRDAGKVSRVGGYEIVCADAALEFVTTYHNKLRNVISAAQRKLDAQPYSTLPPLSTNLLPLQFVHNNITTNVCFTSDGWLNATLVAKQFGKQVRHWLSNADTQEYVQALATYLAKNGNPRLAAADLVRVVHGGTNRGSWLHPQLVVPFARWLNAHFGVWCDQQILALLIGKHSATQLLQAPAQSDSLEQRVVKLELRVAAIERTTVNKQE